ncbi:hypothetical protein FSP39_005545 [Pinctada imbricata]|uniref:Uncharacterized protein n=1 Tax=Pinctada imbricata TaxID=66713 RepID=A0AA88XZF0_PINIB|nr:hypothetical protein FSP39_005545 [Pinctada imbricata]
MTTSTCWSLWQRMPPRYQLTSRITEEMEEELYNEERTKPSPRTRSPRRTRTPRTPKETTHRPLPEAEIKRPTIAGCNPTGSCNTPSNNRRFNFPNRKSSYIDHFKTQKRVNSARVKFSTDPPSPPYHPKEKERATTAPTFPLSSASRLSESMGQLAESSSMCSHQSVCSQHRESSRLSIVGSRTDLDSQTDLDLDDKMSISTHSNKTPKEQTRRKFNIRETDEGTMYIDNGKVIYFKKSRHSPSVLLKSRLSDGSFLASIRREYLSKPKIIAMSTEKLNPTEERLLQRERVYYNQKVGHILDYYCMEDEDRISIDDINKYTQGSPRSLHSSRQRSPRNPRVRRIYFDPTTQFNDGVSPQHPLHGSVSPVNPEDDPNLNSYMKVNKKLKLHDRKFYLRTPHSNTDSRSNITQADIDNCKCGICRIEMQLSLMAQLGIRKNAHVQTIEEAFIEATGNHLYDSKRDVTEDAELSSKEKEQPKIRHTDNTGEQVSNSDHASDKINSNATASEPSTIEVTVPGMHFERELSEATCLESGAATARTNQSLT